MSSDRDDGEPVTPRAVAAYILEIAGGMAIAARHAGLDELADTLERAEAQAKAVLKRANGGATKRKRRRDE